MVEVKTGK